MKTDLKSAFDNAQHFFEEVNEYKVTSPSLVKRCVDNDLPLVLLEMASVAEEASNSSDSDKNTYLSLLKYLANLDNDFSPNPGKTNPSYDVIEESFPSFERPEY